MANILLVEDDRKTADFIKSGLTEEGFSVHHAVDGRTGLDLELDLLSRKVLRGGQEIELQQREFSLLTYLIARRAMGGVHEVTEAAARIAASDLDQPISSGNRGEEIEALAAMFNMMQKRIFDLINELKGVINNVAHDLRMPITRMRGVAETTLTRDADRTSYRDMAVTVIEESDRLVGQINTILELAEIDAGLKVMTMEQVDLARIVNMAVELYRPADEDRDISLTVQIKKQPLMVP